MFAAAADPEVWAVHPARERYREPVFREFFDGALACGSAFSFVDRRTSQVVGSSRFHEYDPDASEIEVGWTFLARDYWGGSHNAEIKKLMLDHAFTFVDTVVFWVGETNWRSRRAMQKIGGVLREGSFSRSMNGVVFQHVIFEIKKGPTSCVTERCDAAPELGQRGSRPANVAADRV